MKVVEAPTHPGDWPAWGRHGVFGAWILGFAAWVACLGVGCHALLPVSPHQAGKQDLSAPGATDAGVDAETSGDSAPGLDSAPRADLVPMIFSEPKPIPGVNSPQSAEKGPHLSVDGQRLYFASGRAGGNGGNDIWVAERTLESGYAFDNLQPIAGEVNTGKDQEDPTLTRDELTLYYELETRNSQEVFMSTRASPTHPFGTPTPVEPINSGGDAGNPSVSASGDTIYFSSNRASADAPSGKNIWSATRGPGGFAAPVLVTGISGPNSEFDPCVADGPPRFIFLTRHMGDSATAEDLYRARWLGTGFESPTAVDPVNSDARDEDPFIDLNQRVLIFSSNRPDRQNYDLYYSTF